MLPAKHRLTRRADFSALIAQGKKAYMPGFGMRYRLRSRADVTSRFGFVVGTKVSKSAVIRNRLKRQMREVVRLRMRNLKNGFDVMILAFPEAKAASYGKIEQQIIALLKKSGLLLI